MPVAVNLHVIRKDTGPGGDFFRAVQKQRTDVYQGLFVVSPEGKVLAVQHRWNEKNDRWSRDVVAALETGVKAFGPVSERTVRRVDPLPFRGKGVREDGSINLAGYARWMMRGMDRTALGEIMLDSVDLTAKQVESLARPDATRGATWKVPASVVRQFHKILSPTSDKSTLARADEVTTANLEGRIERVSNGIAYLSFKGLVAGSHAGDFDPHKGKKTHAEMPLVGVGSCEAKTGKLLSITLVGDGWIRGFPPYDQKSRFGAVLEWRRTP